LCRISSTPVNDGPLPGREDDWGFVNDYRVRLAHEERQWAEAERLQRIRVEWDRGRAAAALSTLPPDLDNSGRLAIRTLAVGLHELGQIKRELGQPECIDLYKESYQLDLQTDDRSGAATAAVNIGNAYRDLPTLRDLSEAERWYHRSLKLWAEGDHLGRARCLDQLGFVAYLRFEEAREARQTEPEIKGHLRDAARLYGEALELTPLNAIGDLAVIHNALGAILHVAGRPDEAFRHYREAIRYLEIQGDLFRAAGPRSNVALTLANAGRLADAKEYALAALRNYQTYGDRAAQEIQETLRLIAWIEQLSKAQGAGA
jgi:tetratricopeptide (TPR) repeat protein